MPQRDVLGNSVVKEIKWETGQPKEAFAHNVIT
jgi:hypothetical protein